MKARMTSRVTEMPRLDRGDDSPLKGRRNGTRASAVAKCCASNETSNATIGVRAVSTSGRLPIAMRHTLPRLASRGQPGAARPPARIYDRTTQAHPDAGSCEAEPLF